jgi:crotonobetainyl-CoA:carnitine CoA-transferase CaiB-like acyl-CoA transferase
MTPLAGIRVLDFSTLVPGPLASLMLAEAGAEVIKIERPQSGDEMRSYVPKLDEDSVNFHLLNRGKRSLAIDLKAPGAVARLRPLIEQADVLIEQFRPGVMERLGLGAAALQAINPRLIYCSITGWGQTGPKAHTAAHDLNYMAETGLLCLTGGADGAPVLPPVLVADIAGGAMPAVINILLALRQRDLDGKGSVLDISMGESLFCYAYWGLGNGFYAGQWPQRGGDLVTGGSPRYNIYRTADGGHIAVAPIEDKFWVRFCTLIELPETFCNATADPVETRQAVAARIAARSAAAWREVFAGEDVCCSVVISLAEAVADPHFRARGVFQGAQPPLPLPIAPRFRVADDGRVAPMLGEYQIT